MIFAVLGVAFMAMGVTMFGLAAPGPFAGRAAVFASLGAACVLGALACFQLEIFTFTILSDWLRTHSDSHWREGLIERREPENVLIHKSKAEASGRPPEEAEAQKEHPLHQPPPLFSRKKSA